MQRLKIQLEGGKVKRYHTLPIIGEQTVGDHSYGVAQIVRYLTEDTCSTRLLCAALDHDVAEVIMGDTPHPTKRDYPEVKEALDKVEKEIEEAYELQGNDLAVGEKELLKLADMLEMGLFGVYQAQLGNRHGLTVVENVLEALGEMEMLFPSRAITLIDNMKEGCRECKR